MFQTKVVEKIKTHILFSVTFLFIRLVFYEIKWKCVVQRGRPQRQYGASALFAE